MAISPRLFSLGYTKSPRADKRWARGGLSAYEIKCAPSNDGPWALALYAARGGEIVRDAREARFSAHAFDAFEHRIHILVLVFVFILAVVGFIGAAFVRAIHVEAETNRDSSKKTCKNRAFIRQAMAIPSIKAPTSI